MAVSRSRPVQEADRQEDPEPPEAVAMPQVLATEREEAMTPREEALEYWRD
jgi:hypothetical protein